MTAHGRVTLVLGGARSGKSGFAERLAVETGLQRHYVATGQAYDDEMRQRIARHQVDRGDGWTTHEVPLHLTPHLQQIRDSGCVILVDCLTLWVTNLMMADADVDSAGLALVDSLADHQGSLILVSNEVGLGIVPDNRMAREFRDHAGRLHQRIAAVADEVYFVAAGLPLKMKG
ncbi:bifunctional adenosylcobinamide kinase/adenosylcobinamide-phosphate guanylyltransferase [Neorhizobium sp. T786]|uniref:bifunctional adenosylcobinamide kinase/adenosylcobinamide-phosphate guanylyltransferase n=1 Tax=Pseudorhizobium xiangyangii TaxID=2883104 RepID=UPI001CFF67AF|nr:bifunctional adenosylcobinamide kinase/adenosylcobinamide-phosphate guanylyltransferase [Neorhizobium xiangyangii]MCB5201000.1 bifunctional adenosylcobinamide kinase/adenosylcobinamide-phosphate guanylyltransferase [Neorhizobium xiangyangii]